MKILSECNLAQIVVELFQGKTIIFPTETSYGLGCDATNQEAVNKIFAIKGRESGKALLVVVPTVATAKKYLVWNELLDTLASQYWPGAVTAVGEYNKNIKLAAGVVSSENTIALRVTAHPLLRSITEKLGHPLVATSANIAGGGDSYNAETVISAFENRAEQPDIILDYGEIPKRLPTTVVSITGGVFKILRQGEQTVIL